MFNKDLEMVACNRALRELLDFPDELFTNGLPSFQTLIRFNARRGEYGPGDPEVQVSQACERARAMKPHVFERIRPDGKVLEIRGAPLPEGGFVSIYVDISDRKRAEAEALQTASYFQEVLANLPFGVLVLDQELNSIFWNEKVLVMFQLADGAFSKGGSVRHNLRAIAENGFYGPGDPEEQANNRFAQLAKFEAHEVELKLPDGGTVLVRSSPVMVEAKPVGLILLHEDISERKQDEQRIRERDMEKSLAVLRNAIGNISQGISMVDSDLRLVVCNSRFLELLEFPESLGVPGTPFEAFIRYNAERDEYGQGDVDEQVRTRVIQAKRFEPHVFERERPDGTIIEVVGRPLLEGGFITTYTDITERKRNEIALREFNATLERKVADRTEALQDTLTDLGLAQARLAQIIDGSPIAAFVVDGDCRVTHWNRACEKLTGVKADTLLGTTSQWRAFYASERPLMANLIATEKTDTEVARHYSTWRRSELIDGALEAEDFFPNFGKEGCWLYFTAAPLRDAAGHVIGAIETLRDVTEQRRAEAALQERAEALQKTLAELGKVIFNLEQTQDELVRSEKLAGLGSMVAGIAHELNTPIGNSLMVATYLTASSKKLAEALKAGLKRSALDEFLEITTSSSDILVRNLTKAAELVSSFKQVAVDQTSSQRRRFKLAEMVGEVVTTLGPTLHKTAFVIDQNIPEDISIDSFPGPLGQVITNLVNNSLIHAFEGRTTGRIRIEAENNDDGQYVVLRISDDGNGIPAEVLPRIFDPFFTTKLGQGGSGLGLNIVHNIVFSVLGGRISAESVVGQGSCFTMTLATTAPQDAASDSLAD